MPRRIFCAQHGAPDTTRSCVSDGVPVLQASNWCMQGQSEPFSAARGPIRAWPPETAHDRPSPGYCGNFEDTRATFSSTGLFAFPRAISGKTQPCYGPREEEDEEVGVATLFIRTQEPAKNFDHRMCIHQVKPISATSRGPQVPTSQVYMKSTYATPQPVPVGPPSSHHLCSPALTCPAQKRPTLRHVVPSGQALAMTTNGSKYLLLFSPKMDE